MDSNKTESCKGEIILYQPNESLKLEVQIENDTVWLTQQQMAELFGVKQPAVSKHLNNIFKEGELGGCMYIIKEGEVECIKGDKVVRVLKQGDNFGQKALLEDAKRSLDVKAKTDCKMYSISSDFFQTQFGEDFREQLYFSFISTAFVSSKHFNTINQKMISKTFQFFEFRSLKFDELVYPKKQKICDKLCVVLEEISSIKK